MFSRAITVTAEILSGSCHRYFRYGFSAIVKLFKELLSDLELVKFNAYDAFALILFCIKTLCCKCYMSTSVVLFMIIFKADRHSVAEPEPAPQGAASFGRSWSRNAHRLRLRQWY
jgi:hypothetical protein